MQMHCAYRLIKRFFYGQISIFIELITIIITIVSHNSL